MKGKNVALVSVSVLALGIVSIYIYYIVKTLNTTKIEDVGADIYIKNEN
jgi:hypothetical protein